MISTASVADDFAGVLAAARAAEQQVADAESSLSGAVREHEAVSAAVDLITAAADTQRDSVRKNVEAVVSSALRSVFGPGLSLVLEVEVKRGVVAMQPLVVYDSPPRRVPLTEVGGGVADVVAFAFRVAVLCLRRPRLRPVLVADEPFKHVSAAYLPNVAALLRELVDRTGLQFMVVSHEPEIAATADALFEVSMRRGRSFVGSKP